MPISLLLSWAIIGTAVIVVQLSIWLLFRRQIKNLTIVDGGEGSAIYFRTPRRLRVLSIVHPFVFIATYVYISLLLW